MGKHKYNFTSEMLFPFHFIAVGTAFTFGGLASLIASPIFGAVLLVLGLLIVTAYRGIRFNRKLNKYKVYNSFLIIQFGRWEQLGGIRQLFVKTNIISEKVYLKITQGTEIENVVYDAYLEFEDGEKVYLTGKKTKKRTLAKVEPLARFLGVEINDLTGE